MQFSDEMFRRAGSRRLLSGGGNTGDFFSGFTDDEDPLTLGGVWTHGARDGVEWENVKASGGLAVDSIPADDPSHYNDALAFLKNRFSTTKHRIKGWVHQTAGYSPTNSHELLLHVLGDMTSGLCPSYEINVQFGSASVQLARYEGPNNNLSDYYFGPFDTISGSSTFGGFSDGDTDTLEVKVDIVSGNPRFYMYYNGSLFWTVEDSDTGKHVSGAPGFGMFRHATGTDNTKYAWTAIEMGNW